MMETSVRETFASKPFRHGFRITSTCNTTAECRRLIRFSTPLMFNWITTRISPSLRVHSNQIEFFFKLREKIYDIVYWITNRWARVLQCLIYRSCRVPAVRLSKRRSSWTIYANCLPVVSFSFSFFLQLRVGFFFRARNRRPSDWIRRSSKQEKRICRFSSAREKIITGIRPPRWRWTAIRRKSL